MRVGISIAPLLTLNGQQKKYDGIGSYTFNLVEALKNKVTFESIYFKTVKEFLNHPLPLFDKKTEFVVAANPFINQYLPINCYSQHEELIDIFHSTDYKVPKLKSKPVIATLHDAIPFKETEHANSNSRRLKNYLLKKTAANADHIITISQTMREDIHHYFKIPYEKISVVHHGINAEWFKPINDKTSVLNKYAIDKLFLLVVGTISPKKNCLRIMQAFAKLPQNLQKDVQLVFVGKQGWNCEAEIKMLQQMQREGQAKWLEYVSFEDLRALYQLSLALIFPSLNEGFGFPIIEAFASNTAVLTSAEGATKEIASTAALLVDPYNIAEIAEGMEDLIVNESFRNNLISKGKERTKQFTIEKFAEETIAVYRRVI